MLTAINSEYNMKKEISYVNRKVIVTPPATKEAVVEGEKPKYAKVTKYDSEIGVYAITCNETKSVYIGQSKNIPTRLRNHLFKLRKGDYLEPYEKWQIDFDELGEKNFSFGAIYSCDEEKLLFWETYYIKLYRDEGWTIYNVQHVTCDNSIVTCPNEYADLVRRLVSQLEKGKLKPEHLEQALNHNEFY